MELLFKEVNGNLQMCTFVRLFMKTIPTKTWWLQMVEKPEPITIALPASFEVVGPIKPDAASYLKLYHAVGDKFNWVDRTLIPQDELIRLIQSDHTEIFVLQCNREPAGFVEFDITHPDETEIVYFGLCEAYTGRKIGFPFLLWAVDHAWKRPLRKVWLHTCDLDHPAALPVYQKAGFVIFKESIIEQPLPEDQSTNESIAY